MRKFTLEGVRTFRSPVTLDFCHPDGSVARWTVIPGENGTGKTTLLQYLAGMMPTNKMDLPPDDENKKTRFAPTLTASEWESWNTLNLPSTSPNSSDKITKIEAALFVSTVSTSLKSSNFDTSSKSEISLLLGFVRSDNQIRNNASGIWMERESDHLRQFRIFGYGAGRHIASGASPCLTSETFFQNGGSGPTSTFYHDDYPLIGPEQWLLGLDHVSKGEGESAKNAKRALASAKRCFVNTLPDIHSITIKPVVGQKGQTTMAIMCMTPFGEVPFSSLSVGYRTMAAWLTDFVKRMHEAFPELEEPDDGPAVVLIDEFDLHMHPQWQREAMTAIGKEFPNTQFIVTAHSPIVGERSQRIAGGPSFLRGCHRIHSRRNGRGALEETLVARWRGGFPRAFLASDDRTASQWHEDFFRTFLEQDIPQLGIRVPSPTLRRFRTMLAHYHGQIWNASELARSLGSSEPTTRRYLDILSGTYMIRQLPPWFENLKKRQVKASKTYIRDSGVCHALLGLESMAALQAHPKLGASWEGFALEQILAITGDTNAYFWATHSGAELNLLVFHRGKKLGFEFKYSEKPATTKSMQIALADLELDHLYIVYPGTHRIPLTEAITASPLPDLLHSLSRP